MSAHDHTTANSSDPCYTYQDNEQSFYLALKAEERQAFRCLYRRVHNQFVPLACQRGGSYDEALDVLNDSLALFLHKIRSDEYVFQENAKITTYLYRVCYNQWLNYIDRREKRREVPFEVIWNPAHQEADDPVREKQLPPEESFPGEDEISEWSTRLQKALGMLREDCQLMLRWFYQEDLSLRSIAGRLGMTEQSAAVKRFKCARYLRDKYKALSELEA